MRTDRALLLLCLALALAPACRATGVAFTLISVDPIVSCPGKTVCSVSVVTAGPIPALDRGDWLILAQPKAGAPIQLFLAREPTVTPGIGVNFLIDVAPLAGAATGSFTYSVSLPRLPGAGEARSKGANMRTYSLTTASTKDKADLYAFGSVLTGASTKPLYVLDLKAAPRFEVGNHGVFVGGAFTLAANQTVHAPVSRSRVDPDSITGSFTLSRRFVTSRSFPADVFADLKPLSGEFSRIYPASDLITKGNFTYEYRPFLLGNRRCPKPGTAPGDGSGSNFRCPTVLFLYPGVGYEVGKNLSQPHILFDQPVDLSRWNVIARLTPTASAGLYLLQKAPTADSTYKLTFTAAYHPRIPFTLEPFVTTSGPAAALVSTATLRRNTRHEVEAAANYNFSSFVGVSVKYRYGSLPPLFQFVDQQVTIGLTFKGAFRRSS